MNRQDMFKQKRASLDEAAKVIGRGKK